MRLELASELRRVSERLEELLGLSLNLLGSVLLVDNLEGSDLLNSPVRRSTVGTVDDLSAGSVDGFGGGLTLQVLEKWATESSKVLSTVVFLQQDVSAGLRPANGDREGVDDDGRSASTLPLTFPRRLRAL